MTDRHDPLHGVPGGPPRVQSLAQPVPGEQVKHGGGRQRDRDVGACQVEPRHVRRDRDRCGHADPRVQYPAEFIRAHANELGVIRSA